MSSIYEWYPVEMDIVCHWLYTGTGMDGGTPGMASDLNRRINILTQWMFESRYLVVFTGAGISTESGLRDFRGPDGLWTRRDRGLSTPSQDFSLAGPGCTEDSLKLQAGHHVLQPSIAVRPADLCIENLISQADDDRTNMHYALFPFLRKVDRLRLAGPYADGALALEI